MLFYFSGGMFILDCVVLCGVRNVDGWFVFGGNCVFIIIKIIESKNI